MRLYDSVVIQFLLLLYRQFRLCITKAQGLAHAPLCRAGVYSRRYFNLNRLLLREQAPALRCNLIITQIGRENKFSAEVFVPVISPLRMQREASVFCPEIYPSKPASFVKRSVISASRLT